MSASHGKLRIFVVVNDENDSVGPDFPSSVLQPVALPSGLVMPNGFGLYHASGAERAVLSATSPGEGLGTAAIAAVRRLAAAAGHPLALPTGATNNVAAGGANVAPWIAFAVGAALIVAAWTASLRARPLSLRGR